MIDRPADLVIHVPGAVRGKGRHRSRVVHGVNGQAFARMHPDAATARYEGIIRTIAFAAMAKAKIKAPIEGPCWVKVTAVFAPPASWSGKKRQRAVAGEIEHVVRPDGDNLLKVAADSGNQIIWRDDSQITRWQVDKVYGETEGLTVEVWRRA